MREHHIKWITSARAKAVDAGRMTVEEVGEEGTVRKTHEIPFAYAMMLPAFRGVPCAGSRGSPIGAGSLLSTRTSAIRPFPMCLVSASALRFRRSSG